MDKKDAIDILDALAAGYSPITGESIVHVSVLNERIVIRALQMAIDELKKDLPQEVEDVPAKKKRNKEPWSDITFFDETTFNYLSDGEIDFLKAEIGKLGLQKTDNISEYIAKARVQYPRAYEPWNAVEEELLKNAMLRTNDLSILSGCFQRGSGSIRSCGQRLLYEAAAVE